MSRGWLIAAAMSYDGNRTLRHTFSRFGCNANCNVADSVRASVSITEMWLCKDAGTEYCNIPSHCGSRCKVGVAEKAMDHHPIVCPPPFLLLDLHSSTVLSPPLPLSYPRHPLPFDVSLHHPFILIVHPLGGLHRRRKPLHHHHVAQLLAS